MRRCAFTLAVLASLLALASAACAGAPRDPSVTTVTATAVPTVGSTRQTAAVPSPSPQRTATPTAVTGPTFILVRAPNITVGARLNFQGQGFLAGEDASVSIETGQGQMEAPLDPVTISKDGNLDEVSVVLPDGIGRGDHVLHVTGTTSKRSARAKFTVAYLTPKIALDTYSAKSNHTF